MKCCSTLHGRSFLSLQQCMYLFNSTFSPELYILAQTHYKCNWSCKVVEGIMERRKDPYQMNTKILKISYFVSSGASCAFSISSNFSVAGWRSAAAGSSAFATSTFVSSALFSTISS